MRKRIFFALGAFALFPKQVLSFLNFAADPIEKWAGDRKEVSPYIVAAIAGTIAWTTLRTNAAVNLRNKRADVILHCNTRYDQLYAMRGELKFIDPAVDEQSLKSDAARARDADKEKVKSYFRRYWGLQSDQLDYWLAGYIDPETMASWVVSMANTISQSSLRDFDEKSHITNFKSEYGIELPLMKKRNEVVNQILIELVDFVKYYIINIYDENVPVGGDPVAYERHENHKILRYTCILHYLRMVESENHVMIGNLSRNNHSRFRVEEYANALRDSYHNSYIASASPGFSFHARKFYLKIIHPYHSLRRWVEEKFFGVSIKKYKTHLREDYPKIKKNLLADKIYFEDIIEVELKYFDISWREIYF